MPAMLGTAKTFRGKMNMVTIVIAAVLSIMVIDTRRNCDSKSQDAYYSKTKLSEIVSITVLVFCLLLFLWDIAVMMKFV